MACVSMMSRVGRLVKGGQSALKSPVLATSAFHSYSAEPSQPLNRSPVFCDTPLDALKCVESGA